MGTKLDTDREILRLAERQHGVVARRQLLELGLSAQTIARRARAGRLLRVGRGVYALGHRALQPEGWWMAAVLVCGERAVLSHRSAARLWGLRPWSGTPEVTVPVEVGARRHAGITVHRSRHLPPTDLTTRDAIPVTTVHRTLLDLAAVVPPHHLRRAVERAEERELFDLRRLHAVMARRPHVAGAPALRALLADARAHDLPRTRSDVEAAVLQLCLDHRLPRPQVNRFDGANEVDFRWPDHRLVMEVDGWSTHRTRRAFADDRARDRAHVQAGWRVVRFTAVEVDGQPTVVADELAGLLRVTEMPLRGTNSTRSTPAVLSPSGGTAGAAASAGSSPAPAPR